MLTPGCWHSVIIHVHIAGWNTYISGKMKPHKKTKGPSTSKVSSTPVTSSCHPLDPVVLAPEAEILGHFGPPNGSKFKLVLCISRLWNSPWYVPMAICRLFHCLSTSANRKHRNILWEWNGACTNLVFDLKQTKLSSGLFHSETVLLYDYVVPNMDWGGQGHFENALVS